MSYRLYFLKGVKKSWFPRVKRAKIRLHSKNFIDLLNHQQKVSHDSSQVTMSHTL